MIQQRAKMIDPLPNPSGRKTEITPQEKAAAKKLILAMGYGKSRDNIFKWTAYWKLLSELRDKSSLSRGSSVDISSIDGSNPPHKAGVGASGEKGT